MEQADAEKQLTLPSGWTKAFSKSQNRPYFHHAATNTSLWTLEEVAKYEHEQTTSSSSTTQHQDSSSSSGSVILPKPETTDAIEEATKKAKYSDSKVAIIVPFRDLDPKQHRQKHLQQFAPYLHGYLEKLDVADFKIFIIEQSNDGRKFNRGKLLNLGFLLAKREGFDTFIFHDVDLLPQDVIGRWYAEKPARGHPVHIARCWSRYNQSETYLGGIVSFGIEDFETIDGFPNLYWGWGGEDDELSKRVRTAGLKVVGPDKRLPNAIVDLEEMSLDQKIQWLRANRAVKCDIKWEVNDEHDKFRRTTTKPKWWGLAGLDGKVEVMKRDDERFAKCSIFTVDVGLNYEENGTEHWTNSGKVPAQPKKF